MTPYLFQTSVMEYSFLVWISHSLSELVQAAHKKMTQSILSCNLLHFADYFTLLYIINKITQLKGCGKCTGPCVSVYLNAHRNHRNPGFRVRFRVSIRARVYGLWFRVTFMVSIKVYG